MKPLALSFLAGLAAACGFEPIGLWPLTPAAFALLLWLVRGAPRLRSALARGWWFGVGHFILGLNWIATAFTYQAEMPASLGYLAVVLLALYLAVYPAAAAGLAWRWGGRTTFASSWSSPPPGSSPNGFANPVTGFAWNPIGWLLSPRFPFGALGRHLRGFPVAALLRMRPPRPSARRSAVATSAGCRLTGRLSCRPRPPARPGPGCSSSNPKKK